MKIVVAALCAGLLGTTAVQAAAVETVLHSFGPGEGVGPGELTVGYDGRVYGTLGMGGPSGGGNVLALTPPRTAAGDWTFSQIFLFPFSGPAVAAEGQFPSSPVAQDAEGHLFGVTSGGGAAGNGVIFRLTRPAAGGTTWVETVLASFPANVGPVEGVVVGGGGVLFGAASNSVYRLSPPATAGGTWRYETLHQFTAAEGQPHQPLLRSGQGGLPVLYGVAEGASATVYRLRPPVAGQTGWRSDVLTTFARAPVGATRPRLTADRAETLYGVVTLADPAYAAVGRGEAFKLTPPGPGQTGWTRHTIIDFPSSPGGTYPFGPLVEANGGRLYGVTAGGTGGNSSPFGNAFSLTPTTYGGNGAWNLAVIHQFAPGDAVAPDAGLAAGFDSLARVSLFGTTRGQGAFGSYSVIYRVTP